MKLILDNSVLAKYNEYYFEQHPKAYKEPIPKPYHPSINTWFIMRRPQMNALKQKWKEFIVWWVTDLGVKQFNKVQMTFVIYFPTKVRHDVDNQIPKFILDGFVDAGIIPDDDGEHLTALTLKVDYDKNNPRTEIIIEE